MKQYKHSLVWGLLCFAISGTANAEERLSVDQIRALVSDKTWEGKHLRREYLFQRYYSADGKIVHFNLETLKYKEGKWFIKDEESFLCIRWERKGNTQCGAIVKDKIGYHFLRLTGSGNMKPRLRIDKVSEGNPKKL